jgi:uncharacterized protein (TIGR03118 family)
LTSDLSGVAANTDPNLVNPWGIAFSATSPLWIADNGAGLSTLYNGLGQPFPTPTPLVVTIPTEGGGTPPSSPTGVVFNATGSFGGASFIFATEEGVIAAWSNGTTAIREVDNSASGAVYKGLAIAGTTIYAADFHNGRIDAFDGNFAPVSPAGGFTDPSLPSGYAPFNIQNIGGQLYVTYAKQDATGVDDVPGAGNGIVDVFDTNGSLVKRLITGGTLNSPWGLALAPADFGSFSNALLVGNFGDGEINAFDPLLGTALGVLQDMNGDAIVNLGLWGLAFGNGMQGTQTNALYFTAGIPEPGKDNIEAHGLFGEIQAVPEPSALLPAGLFLAALLVRRRPRPA